MRDEEATGPLTQASAPFSGPPRNRTIPRGEDGARPPGPMKMQGTSGAGH